MVVAPTCVVLELLAVERLVKFTKVTREHSKRDKYLPTLLGAFPLFSIFLNFFFCRNAH